MIGRIGAGQNDDTAPLPRQRYHPESSLPHIGKTHLREIVEPIVINDKKVRSLTLQRRNHVIRVLYEHGIEKTNVKIFLTQKRSRTNCSQWRIRLTGSPLFRVEP